MTEQELNIKCAQIAATICAGLFSAAKLSACDCGCGCTCDCSRDIIKRRFAETYADIKELLTVCECT